MEQAPLTCLEEPNLELDAPFYLVHTGQWDKRKVHTITQDASTSLGDQLSADLPIYSIK